MKTKEIKAYAIQLKADELTEKIEEFKEIVDDIGYLGVNPNVPFAYVLFKTNEDRLRAFKELNVVFNHCKVVRNEVFIPATKKR